MNDLVKQLYIDLSSKKISTTQFCDKAKEIGDDILYKRLFVKVFLKQARLFTSNDSKWIKENLAVLMTTDLNPEGLMSIYFDLQMKNILTSYEDINFMFQLFKNKNGFRSIVIRKIYGRNNGTTKNNLFVILDDLIKEYHETNTENEYLLKNSHNFSTFFKIIEQSLEQKQFVLEDIKPYMQNLIDFTMNHSNMVYFDYFKSILTKPIAQVLTEKQRYFIIKNHCNSLGMDKIIVNAAKNNITFAETIQVMINFFTENDSVQLPSDLVDTLNSIEVAKKLY